MRENRDGVLFTLAYGNPCSVSLDPIEKKPLYHFLPGTGTLSLAVEGCNFRCRFCQNHTISQARPEPAGAGRPYQPEAVVDLAAAEGAPSISYTYTEPTVFYEYARAIGTAARGRGLRNVFVTNGFMTPETAADSLAFLDAANIDLKAFRDASYREVMGGRLEPVLDSIRFYAAHKVWVEVTTLVVPGLNDDPAELADIAGFLASVSPDLPWHVSRFHPDFRMTDTPPTPVAVIERALAAGRAAGLRHVYAGNVRGAGADTNCPACGAVVVAREGFTSRLSGLRRGVCTACGAAVAGVWL